MICSRCDEDRDPADFHRNRTKASGYDSQCRYCAADRKRLTRYGVDQDTYEQMLADQDGRCAICDRHPPEGEVLAVDHSHLNNRVRALLCRGCNTGLGLMRESPDVLQRALDYLKTHTAA